MSEKAERPVYVIAVSGGVDSIVLLDMLMSDRADAPEEVRGLRGSKIVVAHFDHGIRADSHDDLQFVKDLAEYYGLPFESAQGNLGECASEAVARESRYAFLRDVAEKHGAVVVTAHHQDDVLETAIINLMRGTNRRGLTALTSTDEIARPLLQVPKLHLLEYARRHNLAWREDSTNADQRYLRNYVRHSVLSRANDLQKQALLAQIARLRELNTQIDAELQGYFEQEPAFPELSRERFFALPTEVAREVIAAWLRHFGIRSYDSQTLDRLVEGSKKLSTRSKMNVGKWHWLEIRRKTLALTPADR